MGGEGTARRYRFGTFEADAATGELRRQGMRVRLNAQPFQVLLMLLERPGELLTREDICRHLWPEGTFVDYEHGVNSAVNRIREALGDGAANPRFIETLARRGYRFIAPVEQIGQGGLVADVADVAVPDAADPADPANPANPANPAPLREAAPEREGLLGRGILTTPAELPKVSPASVRMLMVLLQMMYLAFYVGALANLPEIEELLLPLPHAAGIHLTLVVSAAILIPVRAFVLCAVLLRPPGFRGKFLKMWGLLLAADVLWALSPFLLLHHIQYGVALACTALLVYSPFVQRSLILMGAGGSRE